MGRFWFILIGITRSLQVMSVGLIADRFQRLWAIVSVKLVVLLEGLGGSFGLAVISIEISLITEFGYNANFDILSKLASFSRVIF
jgi:hypothetical protein